MSPQDNEPYFALKQRTVQRKLGRCLIRLQQAKDTETHVFLLGLHSIDQALRRFHTVDIRVAEAGAGALA